MIEVGGPSTCSFAEVTSLIERRLGVSARGRHIPVGVLRAGSIVLRPFSEMGARLMAMAYFTAHMQDAFTDWEPASRRFGVQPMTLQQFIDKRFPLGA